MIARTGQVISIHATHIEVGITAPPGNTASFLGAAAGLAAGLLALPLTSRALGLVSLTPCVIPHPSNELFTHRESSQS